MPHRNPAASDPIGFLDLLIEKDKITLGFNHGEWSRAKDEVIEFMSDIDKNDDIFYAVMCGREYPPHLTDKHCEIVVYVSDVSAIYELETQFKVIDRVAGQSNQEQEQKPTPAWLLKYADSLFGKL